VKAFIVLTADYASHDQQQLIEQLQEHARNATAPYKYPRKVSSMISSADQLSIAADSYAIAILLVHDQVTIIFVVSVALSVCLSVCLFVCAEFFSAVFDPISTKLGHMLYVLV